MNIKEWLCGDDLRKVCINMNLAGDYEVELIDAEGEIKDIYFPKDRVVDSIDHFFIMLEEKLNDNSL